MRPLILAALITLAALPQPATAGGSPVTAPPVPGARGPRVTPVGGGLALLMVDRPGCPWCAAFRREIMPGWNADPRGRALPLHVVQIDGPWPDGLVIGARPALTPTFILLRDRHEVARLSGYPGKRYFWSEIGALLDAQQPGGR